MRSFSGSLVLRREGVNRLFVIGEGEEEEEEEKASLYDPPIPLKKRAPLVREKKTCPQVSSGQFSSVTQKLYCMYVVLHT